jgi:hypothetical protein
MDKITMPKACISCQHFEFIGTTHDEHCPFVAAYKWEAKPTRTKYGKCSVTKTNVFITELCPSYKQELCIDVVNVPNRPAPMQPRQHVLF